MERILSLDDLENISPEEAKFVLERARKEEIIRLESLKKDAAARKARNQNIKRITLSSLVGTALFGTGSYFLANNYNTYTNSIDIAQFNSLLTYIGSVSGFIAGSLLGSSKPKITPRETDYLSAADLSYSCSDL